MGLLDRFRSKQFGGGGVVIRQSNGAGFTYTKSTSPGKLARIYTECPTVFNAVDITARGISQMDVKGSDVGVELLNTNLNRLSVSQLLYSIVVDMLVYGYSVIEIIRSPTTTNSQTGLGIINAIEKRLIGSEWQVGVGENGVEVFDTDGNVVPQDRYILLRDILVDGNPFVSRVAAVATTASLLIKSNQKMEAEFDKGAGSIYTLTLSEVPKLDDIEEMKNAVATALESKDKRAIIPLWNGAKLEVADIGKPADLDLRETRENLIREIASMFSIPPFLVGGSSDTKYNNVTSRMVAMHREVFAPLASTIADSFTIGFGAYISLDYYSLLRGDIASQVDIAIKASGGSVFTPDEARDMLFGLGAIEDGDTLRSNTSTGRDDSEGARVGENPTDEGNVNDQPEEE